MGHESPEPFQASIYTLSDPFVLLRPLRDQAGEIVDFAYEYANDAAREAHAVAGEDLVGMRVLERLPQLASAALFDAYVTATQTGEPLALDDFGPVGSGRQTARRFFDVRALAAGEMLVLTWRDVTERDRAEAPRARLAAIVSLDLDRRIESWNSGAEAIFGYAPEEALGKSSDVLIAPGAPDGHRLRERTLAGGKVRRCETQRLHKNGRLIDVAITAIALIDAGGKLTGTTTITRDITEYARGQRARAESGDRYREILDTTPDGVWRVEAVQLRASEHFLAALTDSMAEAVFALDRGGFVTYMNRAAEKLLGWTKDELASRSMHDTTHYQHDDGSPYLAADCPLHGALRTGSTLRVEDDTFTRRDGRLLPVAYSAAPITIDEQVRGSVVVFGDASTRRTEDQRHTRELKILNWVGRIRDAIDEERLVLHAQPIIDLPSRKVVMHELLLRMVDRDGTIIAPGQFLPAAEQAGLIEEIDRWVLAQAVKLAARGLKVHFNLSAKSLGSRELIGDLVRAERNTGAAPGLLVCEITETALANDEAVAAAFVHELSDLGCGIALDDFGVGYGGFTYLKRLPITVLKIDIEFVRDLVENPQNQHVVKAIVTLAQGFGRKTVAEGVENHDTLELLEDFGVDHAQGFAIGHPGSIDTLAEGSFLWPA